MGEPLSSDAHPRPTNESVREWCHKMYHDYTTGFISRDDGYFHCRRAIAATTLAWTCYLEGHYCWFCGISVAPSMRHKHCDLCGAPQRVCFLGWHKWDTEHVAFKHRYQECQRCHKRRIVPMSPSHEYWPRYDEWVIGKRWTEFPHAHH